MEHIRLMIISDNQIFGKGLSKLLQHCDQYIKVEGMIPMGTETLTLLQQHRPDFILFNVFSPAMEVPQLLMAILNNYPDINVLVITYCKDEFYIKNLKSLNIKGCISDDISTRRLVNVIHAVNMGKLFFENRLMEEDEVRNQSTTVHDHSQPTIKKSQLSKRELEVLKLTLDGYNSRTMAEKLSISIRTVQNHRAHIMKKLHVKNMAEMIKVVYQSDVLIRG